MCGRFTQYNSREEYLAFLGEEAERDIPYDPEARRPLQRCAGTGYYC
ncbi:Uncharacterized protein yedK [Salmonella enterica subsp. arizonae]|uniref:Uncharacterized protein yedK n=1 Tax=Salmonella enterica subsp. arizonae TaxID=59203 RepID=A0A379T2N9_SALER|nr:Uncharacterized protein yedK [Salmonella enterica subsp. arizonae]